MRSIIVLAISLCVVLSSFAQSNEAKKAYNKALNQYNTKNYDFAIPYLEDAISNSPDFADAIHMLAVCYDERGDYARAIMNYEKVVQYKPEDEKSWYNLGQLYVDTKQNDKALVALKKAIAIKPNYAKAQREIALLESKKSEKAMSKKVAKTPTDRSQDASIYAAVNLYKEGKYQESLNALYDIKKSDASAKTWYMRGLCYEKLGDEEDALDVYEKAVEKDPEYYKALTRIGVLNFNANNFEPAFQAFTTSSQIKEDPRITYVAGQAAYHSENYGVAISLLGAATEQQPQNAEAFFYLANAYKKNENMSMYRQYLDIAADLGYNKAIQARAQAQSSSSKSTTRIIQSGDSATGNAEEINNVSTKKTKKISKAIKERKAKEKKKSKYNGVSGW